MKVIQISGPDTLVDIIKDFIDSLDNAIWHLATSDRLDVQDITDDKNAKDNK